MVYTMVCLHRFVLEYIEEFLKSPECTRLKMFSAGCDFVLKVDDEEIRKKGLFDVDLRITNENLYTIRRISISTNYYDSSNYTLSPVIVGNCQVNLTRLGDDDVNDLIIQREMCPNHINCPKICNKRIVLEDSDILNSFKNGFENCEIILESIYNVKWLKKNLFNDSNVYHFKHLAFKVINNISADEQLKNLNDSYIELRDLILNSPSNFIVDNYELCYRFDSLSGKYEYDGLINIIDKHLDFVKTNYLFIKDNKLSFILYLKGPNINYYKHVDSYVYNLSKTMKAQGLNYYSEMTCFHQA